MKSLFLQTLTSHTARKFHCVVLIAAALAWGVEAQGATWTYDFGTGTGSYSTASSASTTFLPAPPSNGGTARVRMGSAGGSFNLENPGDVTVGSGTELRIVGPTSTSNNKFSVYDYTTASTTFYVKFTVKMSGTASAGSWYFFAGDGATYSDNSGFSGSQVFSGIQWTFGSGSTVTENYRNSGAWASLTASQDFSKDTVYNIEIYGNNSTTSQTYDPDGAGSIAQRTLPANTWDLWVNGSLRGSGLAKAALANAATIDSFMFYGESFAGNAGTIYLDSFEYGNALPAPITSVSIDNTGTPSAGNVTAGTSDVPVFGFSLTPSASVDFTALNVATAGTATSADISNFRLVYDADNSGTYNAGDGVVSGSGLSLANPISFTISGQTGFSSARRYLVVADVAAGATAGRTFTGSIASAGDVTTTGTESGTAAGNQITIVAAATPTISVTGGPLAFGNVEVNGTSSEQSVTVSGANLTADITVTPPSAFEISTSSGSGFGSSPISLAQSGGVVSPTSIYVRFKPSSVQAYSGNLTASSTGAAAVDVGLSGTGVNSSNSDIIADSGFSAPANLAYADHQEADLTAASLAVAQFTVRDGGASTDLDSSGTTLSAIGFNVANSANLRRLALFDDANNELGEVAPSATVTFSGLSVATTDGGAKTVTLRASFQSAVTDNQQLQFTVSSATANAGGSTFAAANAGGATSDTAGDANRIEVAATKLQFTGTPTEVGVGANFPVSVQAQDANGNSDLDQTTTVTLSKATGSGALSSATGLTQPLSGGTRTWNDVQISAIGAFTLQATGGSLTSATSTSINAALLLLQEDFDYAVNDNITSHGWTAHSAGGSSPIKVQSPGLTYGSYASSGIGLSAAIAASGEDDNKPFAAQTSGSIYAAFLVNASAAATGGDYFLHFNQGSAFFGRVFLKGDGGANLAFGLSKTTEAATYTGLTYSPNTTYLVVLKYTFNGAAQDDAVSLFINPTSGGSEPVATIGPITTASSDATNLVAISLRQGSSFPTALVDGIRVGTSWADVVNHTPLANDDVTEVQLGAAVTVAAAKLLVNDTDADNDTLTITGASATSGTATVVGGDIQYTPPTSGSSDTITYTISDGHGATDTASITVTLLAAPNEQGFNKLAINGSEMTYLGIPGQNYVLEHTESLSPASWAPVITNQAAPNGYLLFTNSQSGFFRTRHLSAP